MITKQVTNDNQVVSFFTNLASATCVYSFLSKKEAREFNKSLIKAIERSIRLEVPFRVYLENELREAGIKKENITEELRDKIIKDFLEIQKTSNEILGFKY